MQKLFQILTLFTLSSFFSLSYGTEQVINSAESFSKAVKANQEAAKQGAAAEVNAEGSTTHNPGSSGTSAVDQAKSNMNSTTQPPATTPPATTPSAQTPAATPPATQPPASDDPYSGYTGKPNTPPAKAGAEEKKGWDLGY